MKKQISIIVVGLMLFTTLLAQNKKSMDYKDSWKKVEEYSLKSLPKSASEEVDDILRRAILDKNSPQVIKALIHQAIYDLEIDMENNTKVFDSLNQMLGQSNDIVEKSVLHSMLGELYLQYYQNNSWTINQRTDLGDIVPEDMKEWTKNILYSKVVYHMNASVNAQSELEKSLVEKYTAVIDLERPSRKYFPSMYDFLSRRRIEMLSKLYSDKDLTVVLRGKGIEVEDLFINASEFVKIDFNPEPTEYDIWVLEAYSNYFASLISRGMDESVLLTELDFVDYLKVLRSYHDLYAVKYLEQLLEQWNSNPLSVEIVDRIILYTDRKADISSRGLIINENFDKKDKIYDLLKEYIARYPKYDRIGILENRLANLTNPEYSISGVNSFVSKGEKRLKLSYRNLSNVNLKLYKLNSATDVLMYNNGNNSTLRSKATFISDVKLKLPASKEYLFNEYEFAIDIDKEGIYMLSNLDYRDEDRASNSNFIFSISDIAMFTRASGKDEYEFFVVNRTTGEPVEGASVEIYKLPGNWHNSSLVKEKSITTNNIGLAKYNKDIPNFDVFYNVRLSDEASTILNRLPSSLFYGYTERALSEEKYNEEISIFTDRAIYRPGQTVYFKAIATATSSDDAKLLVNELFEFDIRDANGRELNRVSIKSNEYGSVSGEFVLPTDALNGSFYIRSKNGMTSFKVEEYKRPTFDIEFDKIDKTYTFGEEIKVRGKAESFSGIKLQGSDVKYRITRSQMRWRMWGGGSEQFDEGIVTTGDDGYFEIPFTPEKSDNTDNLLSSIYRFGIEVSVTDINGETQSSVYNIIVGDVSMILLLDIEGQLEKSTVDNIAITATSLDGEKIDAKGEYRIFSLLENDSINKQVGEGSFEVGEQKQLKEELLKLASGKYKIELVAKDDQGRDVKDEKDVILFSYSDKRPPIKTNEWLVVKSHTFNSGKAGEVILGASDKVNVLYELWQENSLIERKWITLNNENRHFTLPYKESYKNGVTLMFNYIKDGKFYSHSENILLEEEKKELAITLDVFRDKIRPGAQEEWRISVKNSKGNSAIAEVLASMYDLSLDKIYHSPTWRFSPSFVSRYWSRVSLYNDNSGNYQQSDWRSIYKLKDVASFDFDSFNWFDLFSHYGGGLMYRNKSNRVMYESSVSAPAPSLKSNSSGIEDIVIQEESVMDDAGDTVLGNSVVADDNIRRNFNETAFFYPQLVTNDKGEAQIAFTVPDTNTKWKFRLLAHDKNLNVGQYEAVTMSQKELMITPNMPRFIRHGDKTSISTKISNLSDGLISGVVKIEFFNPINEEVIDINLEDNINQNFTIEVDASTQVSWLFDVPFDIDMIGVRIVAQSENFSDGEQHALAVLPNRILVTESIRMDLNGNQDKSFVFDRLVNDKSSTRDDYRLTLEFTTNPAWYAVQALPVLSTPDNDNSISWFAAYYANKLGAHIGKAYPKVSAMISAWKSQGGTSETLVSNLEKNEELKSVLLEETPWVLDAKDETEQMQKLSLLFDLNRSQNITNRAIEKLNELQDYQGGWSWFEGFRPSVSITQYILYGFSQLKELNVSEEQAVFSMQESAVEYIDSEALLRFNRMKETNKSWRKIKSISTQDLEYVYVRSLYPQYNFSKEVVEMIDLYTSVITTNWTKFGMYERSLITIIANKKGNQKLVHDILKSYREHSTVSDEMGMYWANNRSSVFMSQSAVSVHTFIMDAFNKSGATDIEMDNMKRWLLKQKQTQLWESTHATLDAIYALLSTGNDWFATERETDIRLGDISVDAKSKEVGTGHIKESWNNTEIKPEMGKVEVLQRGNTPAWGALYLQYFEDMDKITTSTSSLNVDKQLFVEHTDSDGNKLMKVDGSLKVGDKVVVRITVRTDRDMEFVHIKDMRASCFEPVDQISGIKWNEGVIYYQSPKDASTNYYLDSLPRGTYVFEYQVVVNREGEYSNGITTIQSMYAPEFTSHTGGQRLDVK